MGTLLRLHLYCCRAFHSHAVAAAASARTHMAAVLHAVCGAGADKACHGSYTSAPPSPSSKRHELANVLDVLACISQIVIMARDWQVWGHEACVADLATASVDVLLVVLLTGLAVGLCRPRATAASGRTQMRQPTLSEKALLLELTATLLLLVAWIRLVYAANDHGWRQLMPERCAIKAVLPTALPPVSCKGSAAHLLESEAMFFSIPCTQPAAVPIIHHDQVDYYCAGRMSSS